MKISKNQFWKKYFPKAWMECLEIARLQDFARYTPELLGALSAPRPPAARCATRHASRRTPLWRPGHILSQSNHISVASSVYIPQRTMMSHVRVHIYSVRAWVESGGGEREKCYVYVRTLRSAKPATINHGLSKGIEVCTLEI